jgi:hypothetical protein
MIDFISVANTRDLILVKTQSVLSQPKIESGHQMALQEEEALARRQSQDLSGARV